MNSIISKILRTLGPTILRTAVQGNTANRARTSFDTDFDDDDSSSSSSSNSSSSNSSSSSSSSSISSSNGSGTRVTIELPTFAPDEDDENNEVGSADTSSGAATSTDSTKCEWASAINYCIDVRYKKYTASARRTHFEVYEVQ